MKNFLRSLLVGLIMVTGSYGARLDYGYDNSYVRTITNQTLAFVQGNTGTTSDDTRPGTILRRVIFSNDNAMGLIIYDSSGTANNIIANITVSTNTRVPSHIDFDVKLSSGLTYTVTGNGQNGVTIIYELTHPR